MRYSLTCFYLLCLSISQSRQERVNRVEHSIRIKDPYAILNNGDEHKQFNTEQEK